MPGARTAFYLFNFRNKEGMREFHTCPFSAKHCTSVYLASIHSLSTSVPGSSAPIRPPVFLPCAPGAEELLPKCLRHSWGSSRLTSAPCREWSCSGWRRAVGMCPSAPACQLAREELSAWVLLDPSLLEAHQCLCETFSVNWAPPPSPGGGVCFPDSPGISDRVGEGDHTGEGRRPRTELQKYFKLGVPTLVWQTTVEYQLSCKVAAVTARLCCVQLGRGTGRALLSPCPSAWKWGLRPGERCWAVVPLGSGCSKASSTADICYFALCISDKSLCSVVMARCG